MHSNRHIKKLGSPGLTLIIILWLTNMSWAISLSDLQDIGVTSRKVIEKHRLAIQKEEQNIKISRSPFWPSLDVRYTGTALDEATLFEKSYNHELVGSLSYNLFSGFRDRYSNLSYDSLKTAREFELQSIIQSIRFNIAIRYLDIFRAQNQLKVSQDEVALLRKRYQDSESRYNVGLIKKNDLLKLKVQMDDSLQKMKKAEAALQKSINYLEFETEVKISGDDLNFDELNHLPEVMDEAYYLEAQENNRSEIKALESIRTSQAYGVKSLNSAYYPAVDMVASYKKYRENYKQIGEEYIFGLEENWEDEARLQLNVTLNLFNGLKNNAQIHKAKLEANITSSDLHELKMNLATELKNTLMDFQVASKNLEVAESSVSQAEENLRVTDAAFKEGVETATEVLDAVLNLSRAKNNVILARSEVFFYYYKLMWLTETL
ncbi:MAG: TolC family protein [Desulfobacterales bacterium]